MTAPPSRAAQRYLRQALLPEWAAARTGGDDPQARLAGARVLVVGLGGLGSAAAAYLAGAGVGRLGLSDGDTVERSNLHRQPLYREADIGAPKAAVAVRELARLNPDIALQAHPALEDGSPDDGSPDDGSAWAEAYSLWLDCTDHPAARYRISDRCQAAGREWVWGAAEGQDGMLSVLGPGRGLRGLFPELPEENCGSAGVLGPVPGVIGAMMAAEAIKLITGVGKPLRGRLLLYSAASGSSRVLRLPHG